MPKDQADAPEGAEQAPVPETADAPAADPRAERVAEIIRSHLRNSPLSRADDAWNHLQSKLGAIAADIIKEA